MALTTFLRCPAAGQGCGETVASRTATMVVEQTVLENFPIPMRLQRDAAISSPLDFQAGLAAQELIHLFIEKSATGEVDLPKARQEG